jgi:predicted NUDIX family NTP pyrophosphohydrolase
VKKSAGLLIYRADKQVLLVHPGGPYFVKKDVGAWSIPKGEIDPDEDPLERARIECSEELGISTPATGYIDLGCIKQKGGKEVCAWAIELKLPEDFAPRSNTFALEWPPRSGRTQEFPEVDRAEFFPLNRAREKINSAQIAFLERLEKWFAANG